MRDRDLSNAELHALLGARLTYDDVGATLGELPTGYHHLERVALVGNGADSFDAVSRLVLVWEMHRAAGLTVMASHTPLVDGAVAILRLGVGVLGVRAPVRIVHVIDEPRRRGFAYGTLPGHPEQGEELFLVEFLDDDRVIVTIRAFSRPASPLARMGGPLTRLVQGRMTRRYLLAARTACPQT